MYDNSAAFLRIINRKYACDRSGTSFSSPVQHIFLTSESNLSGGLCCCLHYCCYCYGFAGKHGLQTGVGDANDAIGKDANRWWLDPDRCNNWQVA